MMGVITLIFFFVVLWEGAESGVKKTNLSYDGVRGENFSDNQANYAKFKKFSRYARNDMKFRVKPRDIGAILTLNYILVCYCQ